MIKKRLTLLLSLFIICASIYIADVGISPAVEVASQIYPRQIVIIDAGHGGLGNTINRVEKLP